MLVARATGIMLTCTRAPQRQPESAGARAPEPALEQGASRESSRLPQLPFRPVEPCFAASDAALVQAAREGQRWACEALFKRHMAQIRGLSRRLLRARQGADDLAQDALLEAIAGLGALNNPQAFMSWMTSIIVRRAIKHARHSQRLLRLGLRSATPIDVEALPSPGASGAPLVELRAARAALDQLPEQERTAWMLRHVDGLRLAEISRRMSLSLATVKRRLAAAEGCLRDGQAASCRPTPALRCAQAASARALAQTACGSDR